MNRKNLSGPTPVTGGDAVTVPRVQGTVPPSATRANPMTPFAPTSQNATQLRRAFGRFGTGVTVITTQTAAGPLGMTANSFSSVSLEPPLVLWSPATKSKRHDAFAATGHFCIHVLSAAQHDVAGHFAGQGHDFTSFDWAPGPEGAPVLSGCLATFQCDTYAVYPAGDHSLILGHIRHAALREGEGLMFDQGRYGRFAPHD